VSETSDNSFGLSLDDIIASEIKIVGGNGTNGGFDFESSFENCVL
jgi:hypothetical protein